MRKLFVQLLALMPLLCPAQSWDVGLMAHAMTYQGDLVLTKVFTLKETNFSYGAFVRRNFGSDHWGVRLHVQHGRITGDDAHFAEREKRGYTFESPLTEIAGLLEHSPLPRLRTDGKPYVVRPYLVGGLGYTRTNPDVFFNETASPNPGVAANIARDKAEFKKSTLSIPFGLGVKFALSSWIGLELEGLARPIIGDYIDGVHFAGNPDQTDWYFSGGLNLVFNLGNKVPVDSDGDGVNDRKDGCPDLAGVAANNGCPGDRDGDGIYDKDDRCPDTKGVFAQQGCPPPADRDQDGVPDLEDFCPDVKGTTGNKGCPPSSDRDGDGIPDDKDNCPDLKGAPENGGCPF